jgi:hypothetical protein
MMKYTTPVVEIEMFEAVDVIRTSTSGSSGAPETPDVEIDD